MNLPPAPANHRWRVKPHTMFLGSAQIKLKKKFWFFWKTVDVCIPMLENATLEEEVLYGCWTILERRAWRNLRTKEWKQFEQNETLPVR